MQNSIVALELVFAALLAVHLVYFFLSRLQPAKNYSTMAMRIHTWWGMFVILCCATLFSPLVSLLSLVVLTFFALREYFAMIKTRKADRRLHLWAYLSIPIQYYWIYTDWYGMFIVFLPIYVFLFLPLPRLLSKGTSGFVRNVSSVQWGLMLMVFGLSHLAYFPFNSPEFGPGLVLYLVVLTQLNDAVHYLASLYAGKRRVVPTANPYLTWEGFAIAFVFTSLTSSLICSYLTPFSPRLGLLSGMIISVCGFFGGLTVSALKRDLLTRDDGRPVAAGRSYLSQIDSLTYTSPIFFHLIRFVSDLM